MIDPFRVDEQALADRKPGFGLRAPDLIETVEMIGVAVGNTSSILIENIILSAGKPVARLKFD